MSAKSMLLAAAFILTVCADGSEGLGALHADIAADYPEVQHVGSGDLVAIERPVLLDIRDTDEFAVSRIPGAVRVSLGSDPGEVLAALDAAGVDISGRRVVAYCSVGRRSSIFARDMAEPLRSAGAVSVSNLEHGIFGWHGERRALEDDAGPTDAVHPYDEVWKRYVVRPERAVYAPK